MRGVGPIDERGRLALVGSGLLGAAVGFSIVVLFVTDAHGAPSIVTGVGVPAALLCAGVGVAARLSGWRSEGGYAAVATVRQWLADRRVPAGVPAEEWVPKLERIAQERSGATGRIVLSVGMLALQALRLANPATAHSFLLLCSVAFWGGSAAWQLLIVIPRARTAAQMLARGVHDRS